MHWLTTLQMPKIPVPCTNCRRFHYGACYDRPKECFNCGGFNHMARYCPRKRHIQVNPGEPLPGTRPWCSKYGLDNDPELKQRILQTIKTSPGCAVWLNNVCIYGGAREHHFSSHDMNRGRPLDNRTTRGRRSRSPLDMDRQRSRSPVRRGRSTRRDPFGYDITPRNGRGASSYRQRQRFRSRSPLRRRSPSPNRLFSFRPPSPRHSRDSPPLNYDDDDTSERDFKHEANLQVPHPKTLFSFEEEPYVPLSDITNSFNTPRTTRDEPTKTPTIPLASDGNIHDLSTSPLQNAPPTEDFHVDDPHFILGVMEGAGEQE